MNNKEKIEWLRENAGTAMDTGHEGFGNVIDVAANTIEELTKQVEQLTAERDDDAFEQVMEIIKIRCNEPWDRDYTEIQSDLLAEIRKLKED